MEACTPILSSSENSAGGMKRKADSLGRLAASIASSSNSSDAHATKGGRGALVGWTVCPLCGRHSKKRFALGRGIAAHLHAVHTPWNPGKVERKKRRRIEERERAEQEQGRCHNKNKVKVDRNEASTSAVVVVEGSSKYYSKNDGEMIAREPSEEEVKKWEEKVLSIVKQLEEAHAAAAKETGVLELNVDRSGRQVKSYRESLPIFIAAAAHGSLSTLENMIDEASSQSTLHVWKLLDCRDRNRSTAEHWAAGEGNLACLKFLLNVRRRRPFHNQAEAEDKPEGGVVVHNNKRIRRRDGKTCLHYAARYGRLECVQHLVDECGFGVDDRSGDGTTPLHLACFGIHMATVRFLLDRGADPLWINDWGCGVAHWTGMSKTENKTKHEVHELCDFLMNQYKIDFTLRQKQGHSALHKAAQSKNYAAIEWMAKDKEQGGAGLSREQKQVMGECDLGGHKASEILVSVGGGEDFSKWMKDAHCW